MNTCRYDGCEVNGDCREGQACVPAGFAETTRACIRAHCNTDAECDARPGGQCNVLISGPTCGDRVFFCTYDGDACRGQRDCRGRGLCVATAEGPACMEEMPAP
jgi:hypothetical protein